MDEPIAIADLRRKMQESPFKFRAFDPVLAPAEAASIRKLCEDFGSYRMYGEEVVDSYVGAGLPQRYEALRTYVKMEGLREGKAPVETAAAASEAERAISCLFRGTYASGYEVSAPGIEPLLYHPGFFEAARKIFRGSVIVPRYVFANILIPGMTLMTHTDIPEFRGASREDIPHWLLVVMHHSGLFDAWRVPIAAAVCWFNNCHGGEFVFYSFGPGASPVTLAADSNTAIIMDADSLFHRVERVGPSNGELPLVKVGMELRYDGNDIWRLRENGTVVAAYRWEDIRVSISWKAHCFRDEEEQRTWAEHTDDLELEFVLDRLVEGLRERGKYQGEHPGSREFARLVCDEFYPTPVW